MEKKQMPSHSYCWWIKVSRDLAEAVFLGIHFGDWEFVGQAMVCSWIFLKNTCTCTVSTQCIDKELHSRTCTYGILTIRNNESSYCERKFCLQVSTASGLLRTSWFVNLKSWMSRQVLILGLCNQAATVTNSETGVEFTKYTIRSKAVGKEIPI